MAWSRRRLSDASPRHASAPVPSTSTIVPFLGFLRASHATRSAPSRIASCSCTSMPWCHVRSSSHRRSASSFLRLRRRACFACRCFGPFPPLGRFPFAPKLQRTHVVGVGMRTSCATWSADAPPGPKRGAFTSRSCRSASHEPRGKGGHVNSKGKRPRIVRRGGEGAGLSPGLSQPVVAYGRRHFASCFVASHVSTVSCGKERRHAEAGGTREMADGMEASRRACGTTDEPGRATTPADQRNQGFPVDRTKERRQVRQGEESRGCHEVQSAMQQVSLHLVRAGQ